MNNRLSEEMSARQMVFSFLGVENTKHLEVVKREKQHEYGWVHHDIGQGSVNIETKEITFNPMKPRKRIIDI